MIDKETHIKNHGLTCPLCRRGPVEGGFVLVETGSAYQKMSCVECEGKWQDVYKLVDIVFEAGD